MTDIRGIAAFLEKSGKYRGVFFDMDGVVIDSGRLWEHIIGRIESKFALDLSVIGDSGKKSLSSEDAVRLVLERTGRFSPALYAEILQEIEAVYSESFSSLVAMKDGIRELLSALKERNVTMALVSNSSARQVRTVLGHFALGEFFSVAVSSDDVSEGKPSPEPYLKALELTGLDAGEVLALEDSDEGERSAASAAVDCMRIN